MQVVALMCGCDGKLCFWSPYLATSGHLSLRFVPTLVCDPAFPNPTTLPGKTYENDCEAYKAGVSIASMGRCTSKVEDEEEVVIQEVAQKMAREDEEEDEVVKEQKPVVAAPVSSTEV